MADGAPIRFRDRSQEHRGRLPNIRAIGRARAPWNDLYHWILTRSWPQFFALVTLAFVSSNAVFALAYLAVPGCVSNTRAGSFEDVFFFSVHTMGTIGYGSMAPATLYGNVIVAIEALVGMVSVALMTGITFVRFSKPTAQVLFSAKMVVQPRDAIPHLVFRIANFRHNQVVEAQLRVILLLSHRTAEGDTLRTPTELSLVRDRNAVFALTWLAMHRIDETSPFHGEGALERLRGQNAEFFLTLTGFDETIMQTIHARYAYALDDIVWNAKFADVLTVEPDGTRVIDYRKFDEVTSLPG